MLLLKVQRAVHHLAGVPVQAYHLPPAVKAIARLSDPLPAGVPSEQQFLQMYTQRRGVAMPAPATWAFYMALSMFRAAAILAGVHARSLQGNASAANAATVGSPDIVDSIARTALNLVHQSEGSARNNAASTSSSQQAAITPASPGSTPPLSTPQPPTKQCAELLTRLSAFMGQHIAKADAAFQAHAHGSQRWQPFPQMESLKSAARTEGLWNLWISPDLAKHLHTCLQASGCSAQEQALLCGPALSNLEYAHLARAMGAVPWCPEVFNCSAPDTGNMEVLARYGSPAQQKQWLLPLLRGDIRSCFAMTEPDVASSDATNIRGASI